MYYLINGGATFDRIVSNLNKVCEIIPIQVRINVDKSNVDEVYKLFDHPDIISLKKRYYFILLQ